MIRGNVAEHHPEAGASGPARYRPRDADIPLRELPSGLARALARRGRPLSLGDRRGVVRPRGAGHSALAQHREPARGRRPHARAPGVGRAGRARGAFPFSVHRPRPPRRAGDPGPRTREGPRRAGDDRRRHPQPAGRRGHALFARHEQPLLRRQGRRLPRHRRPRRRLGAGRIAAARSSGRGRPRSPPSSRRSIPRSGSAGRARRRSTRTCGSPAPRTPALAEARVLPLSLVLLLFAFGSVVASILPVASASWRSRFRWAWPRGSRSTSRSRS